MNFVGALFDVIKALHSFIFSRKLSKLGRSLHFSMIDSKESPIVSSFLHEFNEDAAGVFILSLL
eukprot:GAHX01002994.1.p4 GENE.GAHX01002994.1~~GAHX01002994.1.p4  ORF type:complete len:64 (-),score=4.79 GAHX01002994.1:492-683(-)